MPTAEGHGLSLPQELWPHQSIFLSSCSWRSEGLFGQSFSIVFPIQALRGLPYLGSFSAGQCTRRIVGPLVPAGWSRLSRSAGQTHKGSHGVRSYSVVQRVKRLMGRPLYCSAADAGIRGKRGYGDGSTLYM